MAINLQNLHSVKTFKKGKRVGRGNGSGRGSFSGRGCKGQKARTGHHSVPAWFEGGQTPLVRKTPKLKGFLNPNKKTNFALNVSDLEIFTDGTRIDTKVLAEKKLIDNENMRVKILGNGELTKKLTVALPVSNSAQEKIEKAGGTVENKKA